MKISPEALENEPQPDAKRAKPYHHGNLKQALIDATVELIEQQGLENVTVSQAAKQAGVSSGAPFRHFPDRKALLTAVACEALERLQNEIADTLAAEPRSNALEKFGRIGQAFLRWAFRHPAHFEVISSRSLIDFDGSPLRESHERIRGLMHELLSEAAGSGLLKISNIEALQIEARALVYGLARMYIDGQYPSWGMNSDQPEAAAQSILEGYLLALRSR